MKVRWKKIMLMTIGTVGLFALIIIGGINYYFHANTNYQEQMLSKIKQAGFIEKQVQVPDGSVLNYGEGPNNGPALLLIHGQGVDWTSYGRNLPELSKEFHIFAIDCYGHGKSSHRPEKYNANEMGKDFIWFINHVIEEEVIVSGHSSGGLMAVWLGANAPEVVHALLLEDPPLFSSEDGRKNVTYNYLDLSTISHNFLQQEDDKDFPLYYFQHQRSWKFFPETARKNLVNEGVRYRKQHPDQPIQVKYLPPSITVSFTSLDHYDPRFGQSFYDGSFMKGFDHRLALEKVAAPTVLIHANWVDDEGILNGAMTEDDANYATELLSNGKLIKVNSGHGFHFDKPKQFNNIILSVK